VIAILGVTDVLKMLSEIIMEGRGFSNCRSLISFDMFVSKGV